jgi:hypothetical protein
MPFAKVVTILPEMGPLSSCAPLVHVASGGSSVEKGPSSVNQT